MLRTPLRALVMAVSAITALTVAPPAASAAAAPPAAFVERIKKAVGSVDASLTRIVRPATFQSASRLQGGGRITLDVVGFAHAGGTVFVTRQTGGVPVITASRAAGSKVLKTARVKARSGGTRDVVVTTKANPYEADARFVQWTERPGLNYLIASVSALDQAALVKLAQAVPADATAVPAAVRTAITRDRKVPAPAAQQRAATRLVVDGSGAVEDDWTDEAALCNGCAYATSNYTGMWQNILWVDGKLAVSGIDCVFGPGTASATLAWKKARGLSANGNLSVDARGRAAARLLELSEDGVDLLFPGSTGNPMFLSRTPTYRDAWGFAATYSGRTFLNC